MKILVCFILLFTVFAVKGQSNKVYPGMGASFFNYQALHNPGFQYDSGSYVFTSFIRARTGPFKNVANYFASLERLVVAKNQTKHTFRMYFFNEKEGPYIEKPRGYGNYAFSLPVSSVIQISAGVAFGFSQIAFTAPSATSTGTSTQPDLGVGIYGSTNTFSIGISSQQLLNRSIRPINSSIVFGRYYTFLFSFKKQVSYRWKMENYALFRMLPSFQDNLHVALLLAYEEKFKFGSSFQYKEGMSFFVTLDLPGKSNLLRLNFSYTTPFFTSNIAIQNSYELSPSYFLK